MPAPRGLVLYYCAGSQAEASRAKLVFIRFGLRIKVITPDLLSRAVGSFAGLDVPAPEDAGGGSIPDSIMVFAGLRGPVLDQVLSALLKAGVPRSVYKAVVTPGNAGWSFYQLYEELVRERRAVDSGDSAM